MAGVTRDGDFSDFSGYDRILLLLEGAGMTLFFEGHGTCQLERPLDLARFSGDWKTRAVLKEGALRDFNVMTRRDGCHAEVRTFSEESFSKEQEYPLDFRGDHLLLYLPKNPGRLHSSSRENLILPPEHLLHFQGSQKERWTLRCWGGIEVVITEKQREILS
jgi:environmental stress-induced protein Ves